MLVVCRECGTILDNDGVNDFKEEFVMCDDCRYIEELSTDYCNSQMNENGFSKG